MDLDLVVLGTAASLPSAGRGVSSALIRRGGERLLIDCGEGTQRQLMRSVAGLCEIDAIFLTHTHGDHVLGLAGMLKTFGLRDRTEPLVIAGPPPVGRLWQDLKPFVGTLPYDVQLELGTGHVAWRGDGYLIRSVEVDHRVPAVGWVLEEEDRPGRFDVELATKLGVTPGADFGVLQRGGDVTTPDGRIVTSAEVVGEARSGRRIVYSGDTRACAGIRDAARDATLLVHEATFLEDDAARAHDTGHATAHGAALTAAASDARLLLLTHISARYAPREIEQEARTVFPNTHAARDFDLVELPYPERGEPRLVRGGGRPVRSGRTDQSPVRIDA